MENLMPFEHCDGPDMMPRIKASFIAISMLLMSYGCQTSGGGPAAPGCPPTCIDTTPTPSTVASAPVGTPVPTAPTATLFVQVTDQSNKAIIANVDINISGSTFETQIGKTDAKGIATFTSMRLDTEYNIVVKVPNFKPYQDQIPVTQLTKFSRIENGQSIIQLGVALQPAQVIAGTIQDATGIPLPGAVVFDGKDSHLTDAKGQFSLVRTEIGTLNLSISKQGYDNQSQTINLVNSQNLVIDPITLTAKTTPLNVLFDGTKRPLSQTNGLNLLSTLSQSLKDQGFTVQTATTPTLPSLDTIDILVIPSPSLTYSDSEINQIINFVKAGKKLIVSGEWGGFGGFNIDAVNKILLPFSIKMGGDTLRETNNGFLTISQFAPHTITSSLKTLKLYQSSSVEVLNPNNHSTILARTGKNGFKIANTVGAFGVLATILHNTGKVIAVGDTSLWLDADSDGNGVKNINESDNLKLALQIFKW